MPKYYLVKALLVDGDYCEVQTIQDWTNKAEYESQEELIAKEFAEQGRDYWLVHGSNKTIIAHRLPDGKTSQWVIRQRD